MTKQTNKFISFVMKHQLTALLVIAVIIAFVFTVVGLSLYRSSGTAQVDLSRPGLEGVAGEEDSIQSTKNFAEYSANGTVSEQSLSEFESLIKPHIESLSKLVFFGGDPLAPESLGLDDREESFEQAEE